MRKIRNPRSLYHLRVVEFFLAPDGKLYEGWKTVLASAAVVFFAVSSVVYGLEMNWAGVHWLFLLASPLDQKLEV